MSGMTRLILAKAQQYGKNGLNYFKDKFSSYEKAEECVEEKMKMGINKSKEEKLESYK
jgi:hypothetical protein